MNPRPKPAYFFGEYELDPVRRRLYRDGKPVTMPPRAFDVLSMLVESQGQVMTKDELLSGVWSGQFVEENNLSVQISTLRKIFGQQKGDNSFIVTVPGRGYAFVADVLRMPEREALLIESETVSEITIETDTPVRAPLRDALKWKTAAAGAALLILIAAAGGGSYLYSERSASVTREIPRIRQLTNSGNVSLATISPDGKLFAYVTKDREMQALYVGSTNGGNDIVVRPAAAVAYTKLGFSEDGSQLMYSVRADGGNGTFRMPVFGGPESTVNGRTDPFALSRKGDRIAFVRTDDKSGVHTLITADADGSNETIAASFPKAEVPVAGSISWSSEGDRLSLGVVRDADVYRHDLVIAGTAGGIKRIQLDGWRELTRTAWSPDGGSIVVTAVGEDSWLSVPKYEVIRYDTMTGSVVRLSNDLSSYGQSLETGGTALLTVEHRQLNNIWVAPSDDLADYRQITKGSFGRYDGLWGLDWTHDGRIVFTLSEGSSQVLGSMLPDGSDLRQITPGGAIDSLVVGAADADIVVFHSNVNGEFDIWRMRTDGADRRQLTFGTRNYQPFISRDGRWVYYKSWEKEGGRGELRRVSIDGGQPEKVTETETSWPAFSPDGRYFAAAYVTDKERLAIFSAADNSLVRQIDLQPGWTLSLGMRWTPDSAGVVFRDVYSGYWMQPANGQPARKLKGLPDEKLYNFAWSKNGEYFAFVRGEEKRDVVIFE